MVSVIFTGAVLTLASRVVWRLIDRYSYSHLHKMRLKLYEKEHMK
jgi:hypothetical protein